MIGPAAKKLHARINNDQRSKILDCAYQRASKDIPSSRQTIDDPLKNVFVNAASGNRPIKMTVAYMWSEPGFVGRASVGGFPEKGDLLRVALNSDYFGAKATDNLKDDSDYWAYWHMKSCIIWGMGILLNTQVHLSKNLAYAFG